ncbi:MAG: fibronectin type III domain-containing protein, partial [Deltaproteobacteria bacterium]|nr:fibronectin type III domain-containing protein [Candidatus Tharpella sp.]
MRREEKYTFDQLPIMLLATFALILFLTTPGNASSTAQIQTNSLSATAGAISGKVIAVNQTISAIEPSTTTDVTLEWDPNQEDSVTGYLLYYGNATGKYLPPIDVGLVTSYTIPALNTKQKWFFAVKAYDAENNQSDYSNEVSKE